MQRFASPHITDAGTAAALRPAADGRSTCGQTIAVLGCALGMRLLVVMVVLKHYPRQWVYTRGLEMGLLARSIVAGHGLGSPFGGFTGPTAFIAPGYPLLIAGVFRLFGSDSTVALLVILCAHIAANLLTVWLVMRAARELSGMRAAWIAGLVWACSLPLIWMPTIFWDTCLSACVVLGSIVAGLAWRGRFDHKKAIFSGGACALVGLVNPALLPALGCVVVWLTFQEQSSARVRVGGLLLAGLAFCVVFSPWPIRNARVFHAFIPLRTTVGFELWMGNREGATGYLDESVFPMYNRAELDAYKAQGEVAYTAGKSLSAERYIASHPGIFLAMTGRRIVRFWTGTGSQGGSMLFGVHAYLTSLFGLLGLWVLLRQGRGRVAALFGLVLLVFPLPYYITHAEFRYRLVLDPVLTVLSGCAVAWLTGAGRERAEAVDPLQAEVALV